MYDKVCNACAAVQMDVWEPMTTPIVLCGCGGEMQRATLNAAALPVRKAPGVIGDECDIYAQNGICNPDGSPRRYSSKSEMAREAAQRGLVNHVTHLGSQGSDKSRFTTKWT